MIDSYYIYTILNDKNCVVVFDSIIRNIMRNITRNIIKYV